MWISFLLAMLCAAAVLYIPGYFFVRALRFSRLFSLTCAPIAGVFAFTAFPVIYYELGIACTPLNILVPTCAVALLAFLVSRPFRKTDKPVLALPSYDPVKIGKAAIPFLPIAALATVAIASFAAYFIFVVSLPTPEAFYSRYDNQTHLNVIQAFLDSGNWSTLHLSAYAANPDFEKAVVATGGHFYPAAWHDLTVLVCAITGAKVTVGVNAVITVVCAFVFPLGMLMLMCALFPNNRNAVAAGTLMISAFATWPWVFIIKGPCLPNLLGVSLMVAALAVVILSVDNKLVLKKLPSFALFSLIAFASIALAHPNAVFIAFIFLATYGGHVINRAIKNSKLAGAANVVVRVITLVVYTAALVAFWYLCYQMPFFSGVLSYRWSEHSSILYSLASLGSLSMVIAGVQAGLMVVCIVGCIRCLKERMWWILLPVLFFSVCFVVSKAGIDPLKYWLASLWYQTPYRFTAPITIFLMPIAALGMESLFNWANSLVAKRRGGGENGSAKTHIGTVLVLVAFVAVTCMPPITLPWLDEDTKTLRPGFSLVKHRIHNIYTTDIEHVYSYDEVDFVDEALAKIPEGSLVINQPNDGSAFAYGVNHLNTYFRHGTRGTKTEKAKLIMKSLDDYTTDKSVKEAIESTGAHYFLQLDQAVAYEDGIWLNQYKQKHVEKWTGIDAVRDDTPGFKLILSEGDMRLYEFTDL